MLNRRLFVVFACIGVVLVVIASQFGPAINFGLQQSGTAFAVGEHSVVTTYGYFGNGDNLAFAIVQTWPIDTPPEEKLADERIDINSGGYCT